MRRTATIGALLLFAIDRFLKWYSQSLPETGTAFSLLPGIQFGRYINPALFFFPAWQWLPWVALFILILLLGVTAYHLLRTTSSRVSTPLFATLPIVLGGMSNVYDRFAYGGVIDYFTFLNMATWNLADVLIGIGIVLFFLNRKKAQK